MLYLFTGNDSKSKLTAYEKFVQSGRTNEEVLFIERNNFIPAQIESFYSGASLFSMSSMVIFRNILEHEEIRDFVLEKLPLMGQSISSFVFLEGKLNKPVLDAFKKALPAGRQVASAINIFELPKEKTEKFNNFLIANAFAAKDKLNIWIYFRQAIGKGVMMEELAGVLFWKIKDMILKRDFHKFSQTELNNHASHLSYLLPEARKEGKDAEAAFEQFLLEAF